jgi:hypothetical protein
MAIGAALAAVEKPKLAAIEIAAAVKNLLIFIIMLPVRVKRPLIVSLTQKFFLANFLAFHIH